MTEEKKIATVTTKVNNTLMKAKDIAASSTQKAVRWVEANPEKALCIAGCVTALAGAKTIIKHRRAAKEIRNNLNKVVEAVTTDYIETPVGNFKDEPLKEIYKALYSSDISHVDPTWATTMELDKFSAYEVGFNNVKLSDLGALGEVLKESKVLDPNYYTAVIINGTTVPIEG